MTTRQMLLAGLAVAVLLAGAWAVSGWGQESAGLPGASSDPWQDKDLIKAEDLSRLLSEPGGKHTPVFYVGFPILYQGGHVVGSKMIGPASKEQGVEALKREVRKLSPDKLIVIYCGCCPLSDCPNIRPAFRALQDLGFKNVKVLYLPNSFQKDWIAQGFPIQKSEWGK